MARTPGKTKKTGRRWWQRLLRVSIMLALGLGAAYASIPWWLPPSAVQRFLEADLSRQLGLTVRIGSVRLSWVDGVELRDLRIQEAKEFGGGTLVDIRSLRADLAPIDLLVYKRLDWMELDQPRIHAKVDAAGNINLAALSRLKSDVRTRRISVHGGLLAIKLPGQKHALRVQISDLQVLEGRLASLGRVTMSAALLQEGPDAPLGLQLSAQPSDSPLAASASFHFSNIDLEQMALLDLVKTSLQKLGGRCSGQLDVKVNRQGVVDRFRCGVTVQKLDVQPASGPRWPVFNQAAVVISAVYDPIEGELRVDDLTVLLPGVSLAGKLVANLQGEPSWEMIQALELAGEVVPSRLASVLTEQDQLPGGLNVDGPLALKIRANRQGDMLGMELLADATPCTIRREKWTLKPAGRALQAELRGTMDRRSWQFAADQTTLRLAGNRFVGGGALSNIRTLVEHWTSSKGDPLGGSPLGDLGNLNWAGTWEINDLASLRDLAGSAGPLLEDLQLEGPLTGGWSLDHKDGMRLSVNFAMPASAKLVWGSLVKPAGQPLAISLVGKIDPAHGQLDGVNLDCSVGEARIFVDRGHLHLAPETQKDSAVVIDAGGKFEAQHVEALGACLPRLADTFQDLRGRIDGGQFTFRLGSDVLRLHLTSDLTELAISSASRPVKPAGQRASLWVDFLSDRQAALGGGAGGATKNSLRAAWRSQQADLTASLAFGPTQTVARDGIHVTLQADVRDARWLTAVWPGLADERQGRQLAGAMNLQADAFWRKGLLELDVRCDADALDFSSTLPRRIKRPGVPLRARLAGNIRTLDDKSSRVDLRTLAFDVGRSCLRVGGQVSLLPAPPDESMYLYPPPNLDQADLSGTARLVIEDPLTDLLPELAGELRRQSLSGTLRLAGSLRGDREALVLRGRADGDDLVSPQLRAIRLPDLRGPLALNPAPNVLPARPPAASQPAASQPAQVETPHLGKPPDMPGPQPAQVEKLYLAKPAGVPARLEGEVSLLPKLSLVKVNHLYGRLGELEFMADASANLTGPKGRWTDAVPDAAHLAVWTTAAQGLGQVVPALGSCQLSGDFHLEGELQFPPGRGVEASYVRLACRSLRLRHQRKDVLLCGSVLAQALRQDIDGKLRVGRIKTDNLELRAGENHGFVLADVSDLGEQAAGEIQLLVENLDDKDLMEWLGGEGSVEKRPGKLTAQQVEELRGQARKLIAIFRPMLTSARLTTKFEIRELHTFDAVVGKYFDINNLVGEVKAERGLVQAQYRGGLYGGSLQGAAEVDFSRDQPVLVSQTAMRDAAANDTIQAQLAKSFPNNTVFGRFSHEEKLLKPLEALVANSLDARYVVRQTGSAKTLAVDGLTRGRAAPLFVTQLFPGLNLTEYRYRKMTAFAEFKSDGTAENDMVFDGATYDLYIQGTTDTQNIGRYSVGLILLAAPQSPEWNHDYKQGRIPILNFKARIEDGKMYDVEVSFPWPNETLGTIFLKNNIFYRVWLNSGRK